MRRKRELDLSNADEQFRANPSFQALVANWHSLSASETGKLMEEIQTTTGRSQSDLAHALNMDESNIRYYRREWKKQDYAPKRPVPDSPPAVTDRSSAKAPQTANGQTPTPTGKISASAPAPNPVAGNDQPQRMAVASRPTNLSSTGQQITNVERTATAGHSNNSSSCPSVSPPRTDEQKRLAVVATANAQTSIPTSMPTPRPAELSPIEPRVPPAVQVPPIPPSVIRFSEGEELTIKLMDGPLQEWINKLGSSLLAISLLLELRGYFEAKRQGAEQRYESVRNIDMALEILSRRERSYIKDGFDRRPGFLSPSVTALIQAEIPNPRMSPFERLFRDAQSPPKPVPDRKIVDALLKDLAGWLLPQCRG